MANLHLSYEEFKAFYGDLGITYWTKYNYLDLNYVGKYNMWDEIWEVGSIDNTTGENVPANDSIRAKNYIQVFSNKTYYNYISVVQTMFIFFYDENKNYISYIACNNTTFITPSNAHYMRFRMAYTYGPVYNNDIRIYQPTMNLDRVNMGECSYSYTTGGATRFVSSSIISTVKQPASNADIANIFLKGFTTGSASNVYSGAKDIAISSAGDIWLLGTLFDTIDPTELPDILYNQFLVYEKA